MATGLLGIADMKQFAIPVGWDAGELAKFQFAGTGTTYDQVITDIVTALSIVNSGLLNDPLYGAMLSVTTEMTVEYRDGTANGMNERTEYGEPDARRGTTIGHMLPLKSFDRKLGWTYDFLRKARPIQLEADIADFQEQIDKLHPKPPVCPNCQTELPFTAKFCYNCGTKMATDNPTE